MSESGTYTMPEAQDKLGSELCLWWNLSEGHIGWTKSLQVLTNRHVEALPGLSGVAWLLVTASGNCFLLSCGLKRRSLTRNGLTFLPPCSHSCSKGQAHLFSIRQQVRAQAHETAHTARQICAQGHETATQHGQFRARCHISNLRKAFGKTVLLHIART